MFDISCHGSGCVSTKQKRLLLWLFTACVLRLIISKYLDHRSASYVTLFEHHLSEEDHDHAGSASGLLDRRSPLNDVMSIVSLASAQFGPRHITGDVPFNVSAPETVWCWRRLARRLGRPPHLVLVGDSRARGLYQHLRRRWRLTAQTRGGTECLTHFAYKNRTDWCHYRSRSPHVDLRFYWSRLADSALLAVLETVWTDCQARPASCPHLLLISLGTHVLTVPESAHSRCLLAAVSGIEQTALALERLSTLGVGVFWKLSEPENYERLLALSASVNYAHLIYNAIIADRLEQLAPSVRRWSSVLPPTENYIARCRLDPAWQARPDSPPLRNCYDHLHYGDAVQDQYRNQLQRHLCPVPT